ncbi:hypothetical protein P389DRAFT_195266 [Cystobasidium minutum MCA 4210]|uniref:uncharacterized protein n=1 Tax=Cystobasidium minutum MCA 4210 TaxID=1397322 RepID=UPI0034CD4430|eukprot:jgi/Rhomi1/195266/gm1.3480_g
MPQELTVELVKKIFEGLAAGTPDATFAYVADDTVTNPDPESKSHPLAGFYDSLQAFKSATFAPLGQKLEDKLRLKMVQEPIVMGNRAVVELQTTTEEGRSPMAKNGVRFDNRYAWIIEWNEEKEKIVRVRAYLDSALINKVVE